MYLAHQMMLLGSVSPYTRPTFVFLLLAALLFFGLGIGSLTVILRRVVKSQRATLKANRMASMIPHLPTKAGRIGRTALVLLLGVGVGWFGRDHQLSSNTMTFRHVTVTAKITDKRFLMQPAGMKVYDWEFCHAITPPAPVVDIKFEQRNGCKQIIGVGFLEISPKDTHYDEIGRNSPTATAATF